MFGNVLQKKVMKMAVPMLEKMVEGITKQAQDFKLEPGEAKAIVSLFEHNGEIIIMCSTVDKHFIMKRPLWSYKLKEFLSSDLVAKADLNLSEEDTENLLNAFDDE